jgi:ubiquinone/menaquinone biosynthesis C-methylase UbiE
MTAERVSVHEAGHAIQQFNCTFIEGNAYDIPQLVHHQVDFVFLANAFHGVPDKPRLAKAVRSILKPGGLFAIVNWNARPREETTVLGEPRGPATGMRMSPQAVNAAVQQAAFRLVHIIEIHPYHYASIFAANSN